MAWAQVQMGFQPWIPESLCGIVDGSTLGRQSSYVVVEEILLEEARTVVSTWPMLAPDGQLRFGDPEDADEYIDPLGDILQLLRERRLVRVDGWALESVDALKARPVEVGDVFAVLSPLGGGSGPGGDGPGGGGGGSARLTIALDAVSWAEIYDITADARSAATATYSSATAGALTEEDAERFFDDGEDETQGEGGTPSPAPTGGGQGSGGGAASKQDESLVSAVAKEVVVEAGRRSASAAAGG